MPLSVSIIVPVFGDRIWLDQCTAAIERNTGEHTLILVDNGTGYVPMTADKVIRNETNLGCTQAKQQGAEAAETDLICFLDVDTEVQAGWLDEMLPMFDNPLVAMVGPRLSYPDMSIQCAGVRTWHGAGSAGGENRRDEHETNDDEDGCTGACMLMRRDVFWEVGGNNLAFQNGYDDVWLDLCVKEAGYRIGYCASSSVIHHESKTGNTERWAHAANNVNLMNALWGSR